uniref:G-protein coupled receptors family 1 profile domain-containing protein n=1 Tax=Monopterus albus TaxID=43700 RepID=A0A3Q3JML4_MONAL
MYIYIINLALADLLSIFILVAMSLEHYHAMARHFSAPAGIIWALAFVLKLPMMVMIQLKEGKATAVALVNRIWFPAWTHEAFKAYITSLLGRMWGTPTEEKKVVSMIFSIVVAYCACFLPFWVKVALSPGAHNYVNFFVTSDL